MGQHLSCCGGRLAAASTATPATSELAALREWIAAPQLPPLLAPTVPRFVGARKRQREEGAGAAAAAADELVCFDDWLGDEGLALAVRVLAAPAQSSRRTLALLHG
jgi:hypothetical protein